MPKANGKTWVLGAASTVAAGIVLYAAMALGQAVAQVPLNKQAIEHLGDDLAELKAGQIAIMEEVRKR